MQGARVSINTQMANRRDDHTVSGMVLMNLTSIKLILKKLLLLFFVELYNTGHKTPS